MKTPDARITQDFLLSQLSYDPASGAATWRVRRGHVNAGRRAGDPRGSIELFNQPYPLHQIIYLMQTGLWPVGVFRPFDNNPKNLQWANFNYEDPLPDTDDEIRRRISYNPETGVLTYLATVSTAQKGDIAGVQRPDGYLEVTVNRRSFLAHRVAWFLQTGEWPPEIDHCDLDRSNNRWGNLRVATRSMNNANWPMRSDSTNSLKGVYRVRSRTNPWGARIRKDGISHHLGSFPTEQKAHDAYMKAARELFSEFARAS